MLSRYGGSAYNQSPSLTLQQAKSPLRIVAFSKNAATLCIFDSLKNACFCKHVPGGVEYLSLHFLYAFPHTVEVYLQHKHQQRRQIYIGLAFVLLTIYLAQFVLICFSIFRRKTQPFIDTVPPLDDNFINAIREGIQQYQLTVPVIDEIFFVRIVLKYPQRVCKSTSEKIHEACELLLRKKCGAVATCFVCCQST